MTVPEEEPQGRFGTFAGVFTPTILTVLGAVMYLRTGVVVGNAGLIGAISVIGLANLITICTGLSIASMATNIRVKAGGAFSIISQSLGLEVGGSVSVPFYLAQSISVAFYVFAFAEGWQVIFPQHPSALVVLIGFVAAFLIAFVSADLAARTQLFILIIIGISLVSVVLGSFSLAVPGTTLAGSQGFIVPQWDVVLFGSYAGPGYESFWGVFAVFFPAVTGILAGVNMSGDLKDPSKSIPVGTLLAQGISLVVYLGLAYWFTRVATVEEMVSNTTLIVDKSFFGPAVLAGLLAATFSSGLTSLVGAPRILQAIAQYGVIPGGTPLAELTKRGEPRNALYITGGIALAAILFGLAGGGLDAIAPLMTMFFLVTYTVLNSVVLLEMLLGLVSFRPSFKVPIFVPLIGFVGCIFAMFLVNPAFSLVALVVIVALYTFLTTRALEAPFSDVRSGIFVTLAEWASKQVGGTVTQGEERAWKPNLLVPVTNTGELQGSYRFLRTLAYPRGSVRTLGIYHPGERDKVAGIVDLTRTLDSDGIFARSSLLEVDDWVEGVQLSMDVLSTSLFRPNVFFLPVTADMAEAEVTRIAERATRNQIGLALFKRNPVSMLGREQTINVWIRERNPDWSISMRLGNFHLALLLAYQIQQNWNGRISLITLVSDEEQKAQGEHFLQRLSALSRMPRGTRSLVEVATLADYLDDAPHADLNIFGVQSSINMGFMSNVVEQTRSSCLFVRDSGLESALA
ncbi:MAG: amino acid permease [Anaerolineae bacterium]